MIDKPKHLSLTYAEQFKEHNVVAAYVHRPPIPAPVVASQSLHWMDWKVVMPRFRTLLSVWRPGDCWARADIEHVVWGEPGPLA